MTEQRSSPAWKKDANETSCLPRSRPEPDVLALADLAKRCALYDFDSVEMVECKWAVWNDIINALSRAAAPTASGDVREALTRRIELARSFIAREYNDPAQELRGDWIDPRAKPAHDALCLCLQDLSALSAAPVERGREEIPCMVCAIPRNCKKAGKCLAFTPRQDPSEALSPLPAGNMDKPTSPIPLPSEQRLSTEAMTITATPDPTAPTCGICGAKVHDPCTTSDRAKDCQLPPDTFYAHPPADRDAVAETVERCAKIAENADDLFDSSSGMLRANARAFGKNIAAAIRRGGDHE